MGAEKPFKGRIRLALEGRVSGHSDADGRTILARTTLAGSGSPSMWITLGAALPVPAGEQRTSDGVVRRFGGLGDLEIYARPLLFRERRFAPRHLLSALIGVKFPTGPRVSDSSGYPVPADLQPGSGSFDPLVGASYGYFGDAVTILASLSYRHATVGWGGYRRGSTLAGTALVQRGVHRVVALGLGIDASHLRPDEVQVPPETEEPAPTAPAPVGRELPATGGTLLSLTPQILVAPGRDVVLRAAVQLPIAQFWHEEKQEYPTGILSVAVDL